MSYSFLNKLVLKLLMAKRKNMQTHHWQTEQARSSHHNEDDWHLTTSSLSLATSLDSISGTTFIDKTAHLPHKQRQNFLSGKQIERSLDLHGITSSKALNKLENMLDQAWSEGLRTLHIIHGKGHGSEGRPVIKNMVHQALYEHPHVLAYASCTPRDGGTGALYVLLKNKRKHHV
jgi:DNA-nicking Smr family endonuclease